MRPQSAWAEWIALADQRYVLVQERCLDLPQLVRALLLIPGPERQSPFRNNGVVWLLSQAATPDTAKEQLLNDVSEGIGALFQQMMAFYDPSDESQEISGSAARAMLSRTLNFVHMSQ